MSTAIRTEAPLDQRHAPIPGALIGGLFANGDEIIDFALATLALFGLFVSVHFGAIGVLAFLGSGGLLFFRGPLTSLKGIFRYAALIPFGLLALASTVWSNYPDLTLRAAVQLLLTIVIAIIIACRVNGRQFVAALFLTTLAMCILCVLIPIHNYSSEGGGESTLVGLMGSKNQMSFLAGTEALVALAVAADPKHLSIVRMGAIPAMLLGMVQLMESSSAGGTVGWAAGVGIFIAAAITVRMQQKVRIFLLVALLIFSAPVALMGPTLQSMAEDFIVNVLHKDTTLTGRTYLWERGRQLIAEQPTLGVGYHGFWVQGEPDAEGLWAYSGVTSRTGFNFHNQYIDVMVTMGWVGLVVMVLGLIAIMLGISLESLLAPSLASAFFLANNLTAMVRTFTESTLIAEFNFYLVIFYAGGVYAWRSVRGARDETDVDLAEYASPERPLRPRPGTARPRGRAAPARMARRALR